MKDVDESPKIVIVLVPVIIYRPFSEIFEVLCMFYSFVFSRMSSPCTSRMFFFLISFILFSVLFFTFLYDSDFLKPAFSFIFITAVSFDTATFEIIFFDDFKLLEAVFILRLYY